MTAVQHNIIANSLKFSLKTSLLNTPFTITKKLSRFLTLL